MKLKKLNTRGFSHEVVLFAFITVFAIAGVAYLVGSYAASPSVVVDMSSPQCGSLGSIGHYSFGMVGVNDASADFSTNPCLRAEIRHLNHYSLYAAANYPSTYCSNHGINSAFACGQNAAAYALGAASSNHVHASTWWIDVEVQGGWGSDTRANVQFLNGMRSKLARQVPTVGFYSTQSQWDQITGGWKNSSPIWYASGISSSSIPVNIKRNYCSMHFTHGQNLWVQYIDTNKGLDVNIPCH